MFKLKDKKIVIDGLNRIVGFVVSGRFSQAGCDPHYKDGLTPREIESVSEAIQRGGVPY